MSWNHRAEQLADWESLPRFPFGDSPDTADALLDLILAGKKRATCWSAAEGRKGTKVGQHWVVEDSKHRPRAVLETIELEKRPFDQVDDVFAAEEAEGDQSLAHWRRVHQAFFERNGGFEPNMLLWCERFKLVKILPEDD